MNAIIALCHFCEAHGPCILFCTQAFHSAHDAQLLMDSAPPDKRMPLLERSDSNASESSLSSLMHPPPKSSDQCEACRSVPVDQPGGLLPYATPARWPVTLRHTSKACRSVPVDQPGLISYDSRAQISYISGQYPEQSQLYSILRQACVRSLNCEVCPGREGPIVFGEDNSCHVLSHTFNVQDSQARGFSRLYSFIVVMMDRVFLINSWPFLVKHLRALIDNLQAKAETVYSMESEETKSSHPRSLRSSLSSLHGPDHLRCIRTNQMGRSLIELTGDREIFVYLHKYFVFLLKAGGQRITECVLEGPPQVAASPEPLQDERHLRGGSPMETLDRPVCASEFRVVQIENQPSFQSLRHLFQVLDYGDFLELAHHILRGDQVIVRGSDVTTVTSILDVLKDLVPDSCCRIIGFSQSYKESFICNFLGLAVGVELPHHIVASDLHVHLDILPPLNSKSSGSPREPHYEDSECSDPLQSYKLQVNSARPRTAETKYPIFLNRLTALLSNEVFSDSTVARALTALKEEWMNKVKVLYKFSQMGHLELPQRNERLTKLQEILLVNHEDLLILQYWRSALSKDYRTHLMQGDRTQ